MSKEQEKISVLSDELLSVKMFMKYRSFLPLFPPGGRKKNAKDSIEYRQKGNDLFKSKNHDGKMHEKIWRTYTQSIALATNNSEELACGYGNRSALLFHLKKFKECIKDCDRALTITNSDVLKMKLLTRKAECLFLLDSPTAKDVGNKAMQILEKLQLNYEAVKLYDEKLKDILSFCGMLDGKEKNHGNKLRKKYMNDLSNFPRSEEVPCVSKSVAIHYSKKWGRHIVATEDIRPGEIFAIEKNYYTYISREGMYLYCSNCAKYAWSSIPCDHCIFDVYCSESCRSEAWQKYHQWECTLYPYLWDIDEDVEINVFVIRFTFTAISKVGGIDNMKKLLIELGECKDPRTKGFSDGIFHDDSVRSIYSLIQHKEVDDPYVENVFTEMFSIDAYLIATHTTFFGQKMNMSVSQIFKNKDVLFFAALLLHTHHIIHYNAQYQSYLRNDQKIRYAKTVRAFQGLINHDCDPNINHFMTEHNTTVAYAIKPIKKGEQLTTSYCGDNFLQHPKEYRQELLKEVYKFTCRCLACTENWSNICLPKLQTMSALTPELRLTLQAITDNMSILRKVTLEKERVMYSPKIMRDITYFLESMDKKFTTRCDMYAICLKYLDSMLWDVFGYFVFTIPDECFTN